MGDDLRAVIKRVRRGSGPGQPLGVRLLAVGAAVIAAVTVVVAVSVGGSASAPQRPAPLAVSLPVRDLSVQSGYGPTLHELLTHFAVSRPQTRADRNLKLQPDRALGSILPEYTRIVADVGGTQVYYAIQALRSQLHRPIDGYQMLVTIQRPDGNGASLPYEPSAGYLIASGLLGPGGQASVIPDGVDRVRWSFGCANTGSCVTPPDRVIVVPARSNVAIIPMPTANAGDYPRPQVTWYEPYQRKPVTPAGVPVTGAPSG